MRLRRGELYDRVGLARLEGGLLDEERYVREAEQLRGRGQERVLGGDPLG